MKKNIILLFLFVSLLSCGSTKRKEISPYYNYQTECIQDLHSGVVRLRVWGTGYNKSEAILMAKRQAVHDLLFVGITKGQSSSAISPLVLDPKKQREASMYMDRIFSNDKYKDYITIKSKKYFSIKNKTNVRAELILDVDTKELKKEISQ